MGMDVEALQHKQYKTTISHPTKKDEVEDEEKRVKWLEKGAFKGHGGRSVDLLQSINGDCHAFSTP